MQTVKQLLEARKVLVAKEAALLDATTFGPAEQRALIAVQGELEVSAADIERAKRAEMRTTQPLPGIFGTDAEARTVNRGEHVQLRSAADLGLTRAGDRGGFETGSDFVRAVMGSRFDPRLDTLERRGVIESVPSQGGFAVPDSFAAGIWDGVIEQSAALKLAKTYPIASGNLKVPAYDAQDHSGGLLLGGVQASWVAESGTISATNPKFRAMELSPKGLKVLTIVSNEMLSNGGDLEQTLTDGLGKAISWTLDGAILRGDGAGKPLGILNAACTVTQDKEVSQAPDTLIAENVFKMWSRLLPGSHQNATWFVNASVLPALYSMSVTIGTGGSAVYVPAGGVAGSPYNTLMGRPVYITEKASALGDLGDVILADMNYYAVGLRRDIRVDRSESRYFETDSLGLRGVAYVDGQPLLASALTPYKGGQTLSPFVILEAR